jgi:hypothetical protein
MRARSGPPLADLAPGSAEIRLGRLKLKMGQRIAYLFDFGDEWRVRLTVREITAVDGQPCPRAEMRGGRTDTKLLQFA